MNATRTTRATQGARTINIRWDNIFGRRQTIQMVRDTFTCTDGIQVVRVTRSIRMQVRSIEGRNFRTIERRTSITWETVDGRSGRFGNMMEAHRIACGGW